MGEVWVVACSTGLHALTSVGLYPTVG